MKLTEENYFSLEANREYMSVSQYKAFLDCPARATAELRGEYEQPKTTALLVGSYVDAHFEGTLEAFKRDNPEVFVTESRERDDTREHISWLAPDLLTKNGTWKPKGLAEAKRLYPKLFDEVYRLKADYKQAEDIIRILEADELFMEYMNGEKQVIMTAELFGTPWKIKIDSYHKGKMIVDLKIVRSFERIMGISFVEHWKYDTQMAIYSKVESIFTGGDMLPTFLAAGTKQDPPDKDIIHIPFWRREECLYDIEKNMPRILAYKRGELEAPGCGVCPYCRSVKKLKAPIEFDAVGFSNRELALAEGKIF